jgi:hypothetical protein
MTHFPRTKSLDRNKDSGVLPVDLGLTVFGGTWKRDSPFPVSVHSPLFKTILLLVWGVGKGDEIVAVNSLLLGSFLMQQG